MAGLGTAMEGVAPPARSTLGAPRAPKNSLSRAPTSPFRYKPYKQPTGPPPGTYDPGLDAQLSSAQRGLGALQSDTAMQDTRAASDYALAQSGIATQRAQASQNRNLATMNLQRNTQNLGDVQATKMAAAGLQQGDGTGLAAAMARSGNQVRAQAPIDLSLQRTNQSLDTRLGQLGVNYQRGVQDRQSALARAQQENTFYGQDVNQAKIFQSTQSGLYVPPVKPGNEHTGVLEGGRKVVFQTAKLGHAMVYVSPDGIVRAGPPGSAGWHRQVDPRTGKGLGAVKGGWYG